VSVHLLYGRRIQADFPLHLPDASGTPDLRFQLGRLDVQSDDLPEGEVLLDYQENGRRWYAVGRDALGGLVMRVYGLCDIRISPGRDSAELAFLPGADPGMAQVMATGAVASLLLYLDGVPVMHSSAVTGADGTTVAFLGRSGQGKSTLATLMCRAGGEFLTDDVLPVVGLDPVLVAVGSPEARLRDKARDLAIGGAARTSADSRNVVLLRPADCDSAPHRLDAVFIPLPNREGVLDVFRVTKMDAHMAVMRYPRLLGWRDPTVTRRMFELAAAVAQHVPVFGAKVPWGPPFSAEIAPTLWKAARNPATVRCVNSGR
jgi:hypothetical protein